MKVVVIVVIYNGLKNDWIKKCFDSIINSTINNNIIAVDNTSTDESVNYIKINYPKVNLIESKINLGFGVANNIGMSQALSTGADYVFLLNQDAHIETDTIEKLVQAAQKNSEFDLISPIHINDAKTELDYRFSCFIQPKNCKNLYSDIYFNALKDICYEVDFVNAAAWFLSKKCLETVGGFNPSFFLYGEDDNYILRMKRFGLKCGIYPLTRIVHDRINRNELDHFTNFELIFKRNFIAKYSNPNYKASTAELKKLYTKKIIKEFFSGNFTTIRQYKKELKIIKTLSLKSIDANKKASIEKGKTFL